MTQTPAQSLWRIANEITDKMETGQMPSPDQLAAYVIAISVVAADVEKVAADRDSKNDRLKEVLALCSRADRQGITSGGPFTVAAVRAAAAPAAAEK
ncbi:hypothetical protein [Streptomyces sp. ISBFB 2968]|uniref:hypothetical protein n=1 Tax=Streptomyces sp. ISBFB 2968 TaxID=2903527 RepID=UPI002FDBC4BD